jgi:hypothetical protein
LFNEALFAFHRPGDPLPSNVGEVGEAFASYKPNVGNLNPRELLTCFLHRSDFTP